MYKICIIRARGDACIREQILKNLTMKILLYEEPEKHTWPIEPLIETAVGFHTQEKITVANTREQALSELEKKDFDLVIVHHYDFQDIMHLREQSPNTQFAGYHGGIKINKKTEEKEYASGTIGDEFLTKLRARYDHVLGSCGVQLREFFAELKEKKYSSLKDILDK